MFHSISSQDPLGSLKSMAVIASKRKQGGSISSLSLLMMQRSWTKIQKTIATNHALAMPRSYPNCTLCKESLSPLFYACALDPPLGIIVNLLEANPAAVLDTDCERKLPLHLACEYGASPEVIKELLEANMEAVSKKDIHGMLPIHKVCRYYYDNRSPWVSKTAALKITIDVLNMLLRADPTTIIEEDFKGLCPIEHALETEMNIKVIRALFFEVY